MPPRNSKWTQVIASLQASPDEWQQVAYDAAPSVAQRLKELGAEVRTEISTARSSERTYDRYKVEARWPSDQPVPESQPNQTKPILAPNAKWAQVIAELQTTPGEWKQVATDAGPSTIQRLRALGAEVQTDSVAPRTDGATYSRYDVYARWPTPETELERLTLAHSVLTTELQTAQADADAADKEYNNAKQILNRNAYRRRQAHAKLAPLFEQHDQLTALINRLKTEKD
jgi:hypothetical protein